MQCDPLDRCHSIYTLDARHDTNPAACMFKQVHQHCCGRTRDRLSNETDELVAVEFNPLACKPVNDLHVPVIYPSTGMLRRAALPVAPPHSWQGHLHWHHRHVSAHLLAPCIAPAQHGPLIYSDPPNSGSEISKVTVGQTPDRDWFLSNSIFPGKVHVTLQDGQCRSAPGLLGDAE
jgi:hypothetical protein